MGFPAEVQSGTPECQGRPGPSDHQRDPAGGAPEVSRSAPRGGVRCRGSPHPGCPDPSNSPTTDEPHRQPESPRGPEAKRSSGPRTRKIAERVASGGSHPQPPASSAPERVPPSPPRGSRNTMIPVSVRQVPIHGAMVHCSYLAVCSGPMTDPALLRRQRSDQGRKRRSRTLGGRSATVGSTGRPSPDHESCHSFPRRQGV